MTTIEILDDLLSSSLCEEIQIELALHPEAFTLREKRMAELLGTLYRVTHSSNRKNSCYSVHASWRADTRRIADALKAEASRDAKRQTPHRQPTLPK